MITRTLLLSLVLFVFPAISDAQSGPWAVLSTPGPQLLEENLWFRLVQGTQCVFERSTDQGKTWKPVGYFPESYEDDNEYFRDRVIFSILSFTMTDRKNGYATGLKHYASYWHTSSPYAIAYRTNDSGKTWKETAFPNTDENKLPIVAKVFDAKKWLMLSTPRWDFTDGPYSSLLSFTRDAGKTSQLRLDSFVTDTTKRALNVLSLDAEDTSRVVLISGSYPAYLLTTSNGGASWRVLDSIVDRTLSVNKLTVVRSMGNGCWLAAGESGIVRSADHGSTWNVVARTPVAIRHVEVHGAQAAALAYGDLAYISSDSGKTWFATELSETRRRCNALRFSPGGDLFCFGDTTWKFGHTSSATPGGVLLHNKDIYFSNVGRDSIARTTLGLQNIGKVTSTILRIESNLPNFELTVQATDIPADSTLMAEVTYRPTVHSLEVATIRIVTNSGITAITVRGNGVMGSLQVSATDYELGPLLRGETRPLLLTMRNIGTDTLRLLGIESSPNIRDIGSVDTIHSTRTTISAVLQVPTVLGEYHDSIAILTDGIPPTSTVHFRYLVIESPTVQTHKVILPTISGSRWPYIEALSATDTQVTVAKREQGDSSITYISSFGYDASLNLLWSNTEELPFRAIEGIHSFERTAILMHYDNREIRYDAIALDGSTSTIRRDSAASSHNFTSSLSGQYLVTYGGTRSTSKHVHPYDYYNNGDAFANTIDLATGEQTEFTHAGPSSYETRWTSTNGSDYASAATITSNGKLSVSGSVDTYSGWKDFTSEPVYRPFFYADGRWVERDSLPQFNLLITDHLDRTIGLQGKILSILKGDSAIDRQVHFPYGVEALRALKNGGFALLGNRSLVKLNDDLEIEWSQHIGTGTDGTGGKEIAEDREGYLYAVCQLHDGISTLTVIRCSPDGDLEWMVRIGDTATSYTYSGLTLTPNAALIVGAECRSKTDTACVLIAFEEQLEPLKQKVDRGSRPQLTVYPNPVRSTIRVSSPEYIKAIEVLDVIGRSVGSKNMRMSSESVAMHVDYLEPGTYILKVTMLDNHVQHVPFVKAAH